MKNTWAKACNEMPSVVSAISQYIDCYSYGSPELSQDTEEALDVFIKEAAVKMEDSAHILLNLGFELHRDDLSVLLRKLLDTSSSLEVYTKDSPDWDRMPLEFIKKIITKDSTIVIGTVQVSEEVASLKERFHQAIKDDNILVKEMPGMKLLLQGIVKSLENLKEVLRERERLRRFKQEQMKEALKMVEEQ